MLTKRYFKTRDDVDITFHVYAGSVDSASVCLDQDGWIPVAMRHAGRGIWKVKLRLPADREIQFRYLATAGLCINDDTAAGYVPNGFGSDNSVVSTIHGDLT